jgi:hypothetical protein
VRYNTGVNAKRLIDELRLLADRLGLPVRMEPLDGIAGGLCVLGRRTLVLVDSSQPADMQADTLAEAITEYIGRPEAPDLDDVFVLPEVRGFLNQYLGHR